MEEQTENTPKKLSKAAKKRKLKQASEMLDSVRSILVQLAAVDGSSYLAEAEAAEIQGAVVSYGRIKEIIHH